MTPPETHLGQVGNLRTDWQSVQASHARPSTVTTYLVGFVLKLAEFPVALKAPSHAPRPVPSTLFLSSLRFLCVLRASALKTKPVWFRLCPQESGKLTGGE